MAAKSFKVQAPGGKFWSWYLTLGQCDQRIWKKPHFWKQLPNFSTTKRSSLKELFPNFIYTIGSGVEPRQLKWFCIQELPAQDEVSDTGLFWILVYYRGHHWKVIQILHSIFITLYEISFKNFSFIYNMRCFSKVAIIKRLTQLLLPSIFFFIILILFTFSVLHSMEPHNN